MSRGQLVKNLQHGAKGSGHTRPTTLFLGPVPINWQKKLPEQHPPINKSYILIIEPSENTNSKRESNDP